MADIRTKLATVTKLLGAKGVSIVETKRLPDGREFKNYYAAWVGEGHGLTVGDAARFVGELSIRKTEKNGTTYVDVNISDAKVVEGTLERRSASGSWESPGGAQWT